MADDRTPNAQERPASTEEDGPQMQLPPLMIPPPSAYATEYEIVEATAVVQKPGGKPFRVNLLSDAYKFDPSDSNPNSVPLTHLLVIAPEDDGYLIHDVVADVLDHNGADELAEAADLAGDDNGDDDE